MTCTRFLAGIAFAAALLAPAVALADVPPPDQCAKAGDPCTNAGPKSDQPGTCTASKCSRYLPSRDGGMQSIEYDCNHCVAAMGATGGTSGGAGSADAAAAPAGTAAPKSGKGCSMGAPPSALGSAMTMTMAVAFAVLVGRRKRKTER